MSEKLARQYKTVDPSTFSLLGGKTLDLERVAVRVYVDKTTGERFHQINSDDAGRQKLLAMILKGTINVSDVVKVGDSYYSQREKFLC